VLRGIGVAESKEVTGGWREMHRKELHDLYLSLNVILVIKPRKMRLAKHTHHTGEK
jgi:hypothetical protein